MTRHNFSKATKKAALERSGGVCEASGTVYGLEPETRCTASVGPGMGAYEVDHYPIPAHVEGSNTLDNAVVCCKRCHSFKTRTYDIPIEAKIKRIVRANGPEEFRRKPRVKIKNRGFPKGIKQKIPTRPFQKREP